MGCFNYGPELWFSQVGNSADMHSIWLNKGVMQLYVKVCKVQRSLTYF